MTLRKILLRGLLLAGMVITQPAFADLKCGDGKRSAPFNAANGELITIWGGPVPHDAKVKIVGPEVFDQVSNVFGSEWPQDYPDKYKKNLQRVEIFNQNMSWDLPQFIDAAKHYGFVIDKTDDALPIFEKYARTGHDFVTVAADHPKVEDLKSFSSCSVVLQKAVIRYEGGVETLFLRSYFHSKNPNGQFVNFVPVGGLEITFPTKEIWFPLSLTKVIDEPESYVLLDIITPKGTKIASIEPRFSVAGSPRESNLRGKKRKLYGHALKR